MPGSFSKNILTPMLILTLGVAIAVFFRPILTIDETRYISVAWEMYDKHSFILPLLNGSLYSDKPPLLFWLIHIDWYLFGVNSTSVRFIPLLFALGSLVLVQRIYKLLWSSDSLGASAVAWVLAGSVVYAFYTTLFMFDVMLGFWVLLGLYGGIKAIRSNKVSHFFIISLAVAFGILAKSPVVIAHILPLYLFANFWSDKKPTMRFYIGGAVAVLAGIALVLLWGIPAALQGGPEYIQAIFWRQGAGRVVDAFAHGRPFWWYLPWIPVILLPWLLTKSFWSGLKISLKIDASNGQKKRLDEGMRFLFVWLGGTFVIFALISGKQLHYIMPEVPGFALLATRFLSLAKLQRYSAKIVGVVFIVTGALFTLAPFFIKGFLALYLDSVAFWISGAICIAFGTYFALKQFKEQLSCIAHLAWGSVVVLFVVHFIVHKYLKSQDLTKFSQAISKLQSQDVAVGHIGKYHDQFHFLGRLHKPLVVLKGQSQVEKFIKSHPGGAIIDYKDRKVKYNKAVVIQKAKLRTHNILLLKNRDYKNLVTK